MSVTAPPDQATHEVFNQVPPLEARNLFLDNAPLVEALVASLVRFCLRSITEETHVRHRAA